MALFPSLTSVKLSGHALVATLPASLTEISVTLSPEGLAWLADREASGTRTFLTAHFPRLTAFRFLVETDGPTPCWRLLMAFLARHKTSLIALKMECNGQLQGVDIAQVRDAGLTALRRLKLVQPDVYTGDLEAILDSLPALDSLSLPVFMPPTQLCTLPSALLTSLEFLHLQTVFLLALRR